MSRIILKVSGEALKNGNNVVSEEKLRIILNTIRLLKKREHEIGIVVGGGNIFRGREHEDMDQVTRDTIGMLGTIMNALYIKDYLTKNNIGVTIDTPFKFPDLIEENTKDEIIKKISKDIIIFGGGVGKSGYSTDSGTILAADKVDADLIIKMTNVDGVYSADPKKIKNAVKFDKLTYDEVIENGYKVMDEYAVIKCREKNIKILVMNFLEYEKLEDYFNGKKIGTIIEF